MKIDTNKLGLAVEQRLVKRDENNIPFEVIERTYLEKKGKSELINESIYKGEDATRRVDDIKPNLERSDD